MADPISNYMFFKSEHDGLKRRVATPVGTARAEDPGRSEAKEEAEAVPTESVRSKRKSTAYLDF